MKRIHIEKAKGKIGKKLKISGWVRNIRDQGKIKFLTLSDISGQIQVVVTAKDKELTKTVEKLTTESVLEIVGLIGKEKQAPDGVEMKPARMKILSKAAPGLPIPVSGPAAGKVSLVNKLDWRWLDLRRAKSRLVFETWTTMEHAFRQYLTENDYIEIHSPKLMSTASESGGELFEVKYFNRKAYLAQSPQFYKQMAMSSGFEKVFEVGPVFRANPSFTSRHDTEFTMYDIEISYIESHYDLLAEEEKIVLAMLKAIKFKYGEQIKKLYGKDIVIPKLPFPRITMAEAKKIAKKMGAKNIREKGDISPEEERKICRYVQEKMDHEFVFIIDWPTNTRPFYHMRFEEDQGLTKSFDLLWQGIEITTGAQREHRYNVLKKQILEKGLSLKPFETYLNFFKFGCPPHGGFAPGPTRMLMKIFGVENVREVTYLYRGVKRLKP